MAAKAVTDNLENSRVHGESVRMEKQFYTYRRIFSIFSTKGFASFSIVIETMRIPYGSCFKIEIGSTEEL